MTVAAGVFAPGHLGELTRLVPFEMVDDVLDMTRRTELRVRLLPARVVVYLLLAGCLFAELGYQQVWAKLTSGLSGLPVVSPSGSALRQARARLGPHPMRVLFDLLRGPPVTIAAQVRWHGLLPVVIDGTILTVPDAPANTVRYAKHRGNNGGSGYPQLRLSALLACGTRSVLDAVSGPVSIGELDQARHLTRSLRPGMLLLADRNYSAAALIATLTATGADLLIRCKSSRKLPIPAFVVELVGGRVLRARTPDGIQQEIYALLTAYQIMRTAMLDATDSRPGLDPDRASFTTALNTARDQIVHAAGVIADTVIDLVGVIGAQVLANLLPQRRTRVKTRMIKRSNSKYQARGPNIDRHSYKATTSIDIINPDP